MAIIATCVLLAACGSSASELDTEVPVEARQREKVLAPIAARMDKENQKLLVEYLVRQEFNDMANAMAKRAGQPATEPTVRPGMTVRQALEEQKAFDKEHPPQ